MKKLFGLTIAALLIIGMVGGGTWAYFSDTETSSSNQIVAGTLDLTLNDGNSNVNIFVSLTDKKPGDKNDSPGPYATLKNVGSITGEFDIKFYTVTNTESTGSTEYVSDSDNGIDGELGQFIEIAPWLDLGKDGTFDDGTDIALKSDGAVSTTALQWGTVNAFANTDKKWDALIASVTTGTEWRVYLPWRFTTSGGSAPKYQNICQGDSFTLSIDFILEQPEADS